MTTMTTSEEKVRELLDAAGYDGDEYLMSIDSGGVALAEEWAADAVADDRGCWVEEGEDGEPQYLQWPRDRAAILEQFWSLGEVKKDKDGSWIEA